MALNLLQPLLAICPVLPNDGLSSSSPPLEGAHTKLTSTRRREAFCHVVFRTRYEVKIRSCVSTVDLKIYAISYRYILICITAPFSLYKCTKNILVSPMYHRIVLNKNKGLIVDSSSNIAQSPNHIVGLRYIFQEVSYL